MTTVDRAETMTGAGVGILDRERTIAVAGYNRWLVPPAALAIRSQATPRLAKSRTAKAGPR